jgi:hypothetical protein
VAIYLASILIVAAVALFVAAPLAEGLSPARRGRSLEREALEHDRELAMQGLRELEFDHEMGKLDERDYRELKQSLEGRALAAMSAIAHLGAPVGPSVRRRKASAGSAASATNGRAAFCPQCGVRVGASKRSCAACGAVLEAGAAGAAARAE